MTLLPMLVSAETVEIDGIWYNLITKINEAEVAKNPNNYSGSITLPASVSKGGIEYKVTSICNEAFWLCKALTSVTIPNTVTTIGVSAFAYCTGITSFTIPNSVTTIGSGAFYGCTGLTSITIPNSVTSIGEYAFYNCSGLTSVTIPNSVTSIGMGAFSGCSSLPSVTIPNSVTSIDYGAFSGCSGMTSITIGSGVEDINEQAFANCDELTDVYCLAEKKLRSGPWVSEGLYTHPDAFKDSYPQVMTLHVPAASIEAYRSMEPWKSFGNIVTIEDGDIPATQKCATPSISFNNGEVSFTCETEGAEFVSEVKASDAKLYYDSEYTLSQKYTISVYATKTGYDNSDTVTRDIIITGDGKAIIVGDVDGDGKVNVADHVELSRIILNQ